MDLGVTAIDTSSNYFGFLSHETLARTAGDLLPMFTISTKVGYFRRAGRTEHSLDPRRLRAAVLRTARDLGREPDLVFLHNPEHSLRETAPHSRDALTRACAALDDATASGLCGAWGIASWNPTLLLALIARSVPRPSVLMVRAGLLTGTRTLDAADALSAAWGLDDGTVWGMSPFGGNTNSPVWGRVDPRVFLRDGADVSRIQAAFRVAYLLPRVGMVAVGTNEPDHLSELVSVLRREVDQQAIDEYRNLLRDRLRGQPA